MVATGGDLKRCYQAQAMTNAQGEYYLTDVIAAVTMKAVPLKLYTQ